MTPQVEMMCALIIKDFRSDMRSLSGPAAIMLFVLAVLFMLYLTLDDLTGRSWFALFWVVILFAAVNTVLKGLFQDLGARRMYYYTISTPATYLIAKMLYHAIWLLVVALLTATAMTVFFGSPVLHWWMFLCAMVFGVLGLSIVFSFLSALGNQSGNASTMLSILGFPCAVGVLLSALKVSLTSGVPTLMFRIDQDLLMLSGLDLLLLGICLLLFQFVWKA